MPNINCRPYTPSQLAAILVVGHSVRSGPHPSEADCLANCVDTGTGTGTNLETGTGTILTTGTGSDYTYYWYCVAAPADTGTGTEEPGELATGTSVGGNFECLLLAVHQHNSLMLAGWTFGGGPYSTAEECATFCHGLTGTGTLEQGAWYCMNEITTVTNPSCFPCPTEPTHWRFSHGSPFWQPSIRLIRTNCSLWVQTSSNEMLPGAPCFANGVSWYLLFNVSTLQFELRLQSVNGAFVNPVKWFCPLNAWNCVGPNTLVGGVVGSSCPGLGLDTTITVYPD